MVELQTNAKADITSKILLFTLSNVNGMVVESESHLLALL